MFGFSLNYWLFFIFYILVEEFGNFDSVIINDDFEKVYVDLKNRIYKVRDLF